MKVISIAAVTWLILAAPNSVNAQEWTPKREHVPEKKAEYSPYVDDYFPQRRVLGGHTPPFFLFLRFRDVRKHAWAGGVVPVRPG